MKSIRYISWVCYLVGCALVFGSYLDIVPHGLAWIGWAVGMMGWLIISFGHRFYDKPGRNDSDEDLRP